MADPLANIQTIDTSPCTLQSLNCWQESLGRWVCLNVGTVQFEAMVVDIIPVREGDYNYEIVALTLGEPPKGFDPSEWAKMDATVWVLPPASDDKLCSATRVQKITDSEAMNTVTAVAGEGTFVSVGRDGTMRTASMSWRDKHAISARGGEFVCMVAGRGGMVVVGLNYPAFDPAQEIEFRPEGVVDTRFQFHAEADLNALYGRTSRRLHRFPRPQFWRAFQELRRRG